MYYNAQTECLDLEAKLRKIGTGYGILIPKKKIDELGIKENDTIVIKRIERPVDDIRGILKGKAFEFEREHRDHDIRVFKNRKTH
jgi:hypothetical protein